MEPSRELSDGMTESFSYFPREKCRPVFSFVFNGQTFIRIMKPDAEESKNATLKTNN